MPGARPSAERVGDDRQICGCTAMGGADGGVGTGQRSAELPPEGREERVLAPRRGRAPALQPRQSPAGWLSYVISTHLKEKSAQMNRQTNKANNNRRSWPQATF